MIDEPECVNRAGTRVRCFLEKPYILAYNEDVLRNILYCLLHPPNAMSASFIHVMKQVLNTFVNGVVPPQRCPFTGSVAANDFREFFQSLISLKKTKQ
ncbi:hypothetical protein CEXT_783051 [Caerostris extrusa]|uniref:Uncharacterized protein n=1 Tax=Caerostris extrusa TaxID=172846 RepID=A0AAV4R540_CAEEX|nr:hypothetical protein CEXT_783051 [Caerostris extrusa]